MNVEREIMRAIVEYRTQRQVASIYAAGLKNPDGVNWERINRMLLVRWSKGGAWKVRHLARQLASQEPLTIGQQPRNCFEHIEADQKQNKHHVVPSWRPKRPSFRTTAAPGSADKVAALVWRIEHGEELWYDGDGPEDVES